MRQLSKILLAIAGSLVGMQVFGSSLVNSGYYEAGCNEGLYRFSMEVRNAVSHAGKPDNTFFVFLNAGYTDRKKVSRITNAFNKEDVDTLQILLKAWDQCISSNDKTILHCEIDHTNDKPIELYGSMYSSNGKVTLRLSKLNFSSEVSRDGQYGSFKFDMTEYETGIRKIVSFASSKCEIW